MTPSLRVVRVRRPDTFERIAAFVLEAIAAVKYPCGRPDDIYDALYRVVHSHDLGIFVGYDDEDPKAILICLLPSSPLMMYPQVPIAYNAGSRELSRMIGKRFSTWLSASGFDQFLCCNYAHDNEPFIRMMRHVGHGRVVGSLIQVYIA